MVKQSKSEQMVSQALELLIKVMAAYQDVYDEVTHQKPFATLDYDELSSRLNKNIVLAHKSQDKLTENDIQIDHASEVLRDVIDASQAYARIVDGLGAKANRTGKYGWLSYRGDIKIHDQKRKKYLISVGVFLASLQGDDTTDEESVDVTAHILDPKAHGVLTDELSIPSSDYVQSGDGKGNVYVIRSYDNGEQKSMLVEKSTFDILASVFAEADANMPTHEDIEEQINAMIDGARVEDKKTKK